MLEMEYTYAEGTEKKKGAVKALWDQLSSFL